MGSHRGAHLTNAAEYHELHAIWPSEAAGLEHLQRARQTGHLVGIYDAIQAGIDDFGYASVCETHGTLILHSSKNLARYHGRTPAEWCEECRAELEPAFAGDRE